MLSYSDIKKLNLKGNVLPLFKKIPADLDTPVSAYMKLTKGKKDSFLLESVEGGEKLARYSFLGFDPFLIIEGNQETVILKNGKQSRELDGRPDQFIEELFKFYKPVKIESLPRFTGGGVGFFAYDTIRWMEKIPDNNPDQIQFPEIRFGLFKNIVVFDHLKQEIIIIANILHDKEDSGLKEKYKQAIADIDGIVEKLNSHVSNKRKIRKSKTIIKPSYTKEEFCSLVKKAKKYIKEGDIFQVVLSQRWQLNSSKDSLSVYRRLRRINPSPYMYLLNYGDDAIVGASPEMLVRVENNIIETRPIAGTRPRGENEQEDNVRIKDLLSDEKELAEHTMLVDLGRNDLGRVSESGTVVLKDNMVIEKYSHVIHIVSSVVGKLKKKISPIDGHFACFPAGTVTGAPKIRAMEIIDELEKERRGVYAGTIAYLDFWGNLDSCIAIRTIIKRKNKYFVQAGAGIVADSKPTKEFKETESKANALIESIVGED
ncbi:MAG: anthranilate synthase component I [candidate division Zixibacteria bacterium]|nr:anthranilate synthase component I [candidate division Zixibacteria bacterium]